MILDLKRFAELLDQSDVRYVLVGGMAVVVHGGTRVTQDVDLAIAFDLENRHN